MNIASIKKMLVLIIALALTACVAPRPSNDGCGEFSSLGDGRQSGPALIWQEPGPAYTCRVYPVYPKEQAGQDVKGSVTLLYDIAPDGTTNNIRVTESKPQGVFEEAAIESVRKSRFEKSLEGYRDRPININFGMPDVIRF